MSGPTLQMAGAREPQAAKNSANVREHQPLASDLGRING